MTLDDITRRRLDRTQFNTEVSPVEVLRYLLDAIERGEVRSRYTYNKFKEILADNRESE